MAHGVTLARRPAPAARGVRRAWLGLALAAAACGAPGSRATYGDLTIASAQTWSNQAVTVTGVLTIAPGGSLTLDNTTLVFNPAIQDTSSFVIQGGSFQATNHSLVRSGTGKQWNLEARGRCTVAFRNSKATNHSGLRMHDACSFLADSSAVEEVQVRDDSAVAIRNGAQAYLVLFFTDGAVALGNGEVSSGNGLLRSFTFHSGIGTTGHVDLANANIEGFQLDLVNKAAVDIASGTNIVLAMHLDNVGSRAAAVTEASNITSPSLRSGALDFSAYGNPRFTYSSSQISSFNVYLTGSSNVSFTGTVDVIEPDAANSSILTFGPGVSVHANLAMARDTAQLILNGSTLVSGNGTSPSFTALDGSAIRLVSVAATPDTKVQSVGQGQVQITGGSGWSPSMFETLDPVAPGGIFVR